MTAVLSDRGPHLHGLEALDELGCVQRSATRSIEVRVSEAVRDHSLVLITGPCGTGKSFATARAAEVAQQRSPELDVVWLELATSTRGRALAAELSAQICGEIPSDGAPLRRLRQNMARHLGEVERLLVLDEAQHVTPEAMHLLRWLHDRVDARFALVVVGTPLLENKLPAELRSRVTSHVKVGRLADTEAAEVLATYHPIFAGADPALLGSLNRLQAHGEFRWWAKFLLRAHRYLPRLGGELTVTAADAICAELGAGAR